MKRRIGADIHWLNIHIRRYLDQECSRPEMREVTGVNGRIIRFLSEREHQDVYQKDLEKEFGVTRSTASRVLMLMEQKGLVERRGVEHDGRLKKLVLTDKSRALVSAMRRVGEQLDEKLLTGFSPAERAALEEGLARLMRNIAPDKTRLPFEQGGAREEEE